MSETLTFNNTTPEQAELNADEQESLAIGEDMAQEQETLLAGKYKSSEDLEKAYLELQQKLGDSTSEEEVDEPEEVEPLDESSSDEELINGLDSEDVEALQEMAGG